MRTGRASPTTFEHQTRAIRAALLGVVLGTLLAAVKIAAGLIGHSYALIADGIESLLDIVGSLVVWGSLRIAALPPDRDHPYGHGKAEPLAVIAVALFLLVACVGLAVQSVREIVTPHHAPVPFTLAVLLLVITAKELLYHRLNRIGRAAGSTALQADAWHQRSDALTSIAAFVGISVALVGGRSYASADDWAALAACTIIGYNGIRLLRLAVSEIMDTAAPDSLLEAIRAEALQVSGASAVEKCFARKSGPGWLVDLHLEVDGTITVAEGHAIAHRVKRGLLSSDLRIRDALVHVEPAGDVPEDRGPGNLPRRARESPHSSPQGSRRAVARPAPPSVD